MTLAIDITDRRNLNNEVHHELLPKKSKVMPCQPFILQEKTFNQLYITNKTERFSFQSGHAMRVMKLIKEDWPIVLRLLFKSFITKVLEYKASYNKRINLYARTKE